MVKSFSLDLYVNLACVDTALTLRIFINLGVVLDGRLFVALFWQVVFFLDRPTLVLARTLVLLAPIHLTFSLLFELFFVADVALVFNCVNHLHTFVSAFLERVFAILHLYNLVSISFGLE